jgi:PLP dependent protein
VAEVRRRVAAAAARAGRSPEEIRVLAISKTRPVEVIELAYRAGICDLGENRVQEAEDKFDPRPFAPMTLHLVGHLQSNKAKVAARLFDFVHSVDSTHVAESLNNQLANLGKRMPVLLQVNTSGEESKFGFSPEEVSGAVPQILALPNLEVRGLMTVAAIVPVPEQARPYFRQLRQLRDQLAEAHPTAPWGELSMGMTDDFEVAIEEGATMIRLGRVIFGPRSVNPA